MNSLPLEDSPTQHLPTCPISGAPASAAAAQTARHAASPASRPLSRSASRTRSSTRAVSNCAMSPIRHTTRAPSTFATTRPRSSANPTRSPRHRVLQPLVLPLLLFRRIADRVPHRRLLLHRPEPDRAQVEARYHPERLPRRPMLRGVLPVLRARAHGPRAQGARHLQHGAAQRPAASHPRALQHDHGHPQVRTAKPTPGAPILG